VDEYCTRGSNHFRFDSASAFFLLFWAFATVVESVRASQLRSGLIATARSVTEKVFSFSVLGERLTFVWFYCAMILLWVPAQCLYLLSRLQLSLVAVI